MMFNVSRSPPLALQPSLGYYFAKVNKKWREGYEVQTTATGHIVSDPVLSRVIIVSISGGYNDYQVDLSYGGTLSTILCLQISDY